MKKDKRKKHSIRNRIKGQVAKLDTKLIKGKYYYMDYTALPHSEQREEMEKGMRAGGIRIVGGVFLIMVCIIILVVIAQRV